MTLRVDQTDATTTAGNHAADHVATNTQVNANTTAITTLQGQVIDKATATTKGDLLVATANATLTRLPVGSANQLLSVDSAQATGVKWIDPPSGSSTTPRTHQTVVGASGGDYTTVTAALAAGKTSIWVRDGTYVETFTSIPADTTITGESWNAILTFGDTYSVEIHDRVQVRNIKVKNWNNSKGFWASASTDYCEFDRCYFQATTSSTNNVIQMGFMIHLEIHDCVFDNSTASVTTRWLWDATHYSTPQIYHNWFIGYQICSLNIIQGSIYKFENNYVQGTWTGSTTGAVVDVDFVGSLHDCSVANNYLATTGGATNVRGVRFQNCSDSVVRDNSIAVDPSNGRCIDLVNTDNILIDSNMYTQGLTGLQIDSNSDRTRIGVNGVTLSSGISNELIDSSTTSIRVLTTTDAPVYKADYTTKGDLMGRTATAATRIPVGTDGKVLTADSSAALGVSYQTPATGNNPLEVKDEGSSLTVATTSINFTGAGITATNVSGAVTVDVPQNITVAGNNAFSVYRNVGYNPGTSLQQLPFDTKSYDTDSCFDTSTAKFTAPATGKYWFHFSLNGNFSALGILCLYVNGSQVKVGYTAAQQGDLTAVVPVTSGQTVECKIQSIDAAISSGSQGNWFEGYRVA
jgi:hypothetical protein